MERRSTFGALSVVALLTMALVALPAIVGAQSSAADNESGPSPDSIAAINEDLRVADGWTRVVQAAGGPGMTWIEPGLGGVVAVLQPDDGPATAFRSPDGTEWDAVRLPPDLGAVSDVMTFQGDLALITEEVRTDEAWSFDLWTTADGTDWQLVGSPSLEADPALAGQARTILGFRQVEGGFVGFESYSPAGSDTTAGRVFVWQSPDGASRARREVEKPGSDIIAAGSRILEGDREQLYTIKPGFPPRLLVSGGGVQWDDAGALIHSLDDPSGAAAMAPARDALVVVGRSSDSEPDAERWAIYRGPPDGHWLHSKTIPGMESVDIVLDRNIGVVAGITAPSGDAGSSDSFVATSTDRGRTWRTQPAIADAQSCLGSLTSIGDVALLGSGCPTTGGMAILEARLDSFVPEPKSSVTTSVPTAPKALECDFGRSGVDSGRGIWGVGERGYDDPRDAMQAFVREGWVVPRSGYRELARDESSVLYGYRNKGEVKVAVRVVAVRGAQDDWVADRLSSCRLTEFGAKAEMEPGVWLWSNRWDRTIQERRGPAHCDWESARFLNWVPPGTPETLRATKLYLRDPRGIFRKESAVPYLGKTTLPSDAHYTGFRRAGAALWLAADERAMYVKNGNRVERWPRAQSGIGCA